MLSERDNYLQRIEDLHQQIIRLLENLPSDALNWRPLDTGDEHITNSIAVLAAHICGAEHYWIGEITGRMPPSRDRAAEFRLQADSPAPLLQLLEQTIAETRAVLGAMDEAELDEERIVSGRPVTVRWGILHVIDHTALHLGHMQMTYQLWAGGKSAASPHWYERLPGNSAAP